MDLLGELTDDERRQILSRGRTRTFATREVLFHEGDPGDSLFVVRRGRVAVQVTTSFGESVSLVVLGAGDVFGELALLGDGTVRSASVVALEPTEVWCLDRDAFRRLRRTCPGVDDFLVHTLGAVVRRLTGLLIESLFLPVETRVMRRLIDLERQYGGPAPPTTIPLTQDQIAALAGASRVTVNQVLQVAAAEGLVRLQRGRLLILDPVELARRAE